MPTETQIPPKCPECGRLTVDNTRHCKPGAEPGNAAFWARHCLTMQCRCGVVYAAQGHYPRRTP